MCVDTIAAGCTTAATSCLKFQGGALKGASPHCSCSWRSQALDSCTPFGASATLCLFLQGKKLPASISEDAEEGEVSDEDSADEIDDDYKLLNGDVSRKL